MPSARTLLRSVGLCLFALLPALRAATTNTTNTAELVRLAYGEALTPDEKQAKSAARARLDQLGAGKLRALMEHVHVPNMYLRFDIDSIVHRNRDKVGPILLDFLDSEHPRTRKYAAYYLGFTPLDAERERVAPLLDHDDTATAALRTLGKWHATNELDRVRTFLDHPAERRRIAAVNALRDIGDPRAVPALLPLLDDPTMTARYATERALAGLADPAPLLAALPGASPTARRHLVRALGTMRTEDALPTLRRYLDHEDRGLRADAKEAIRHIESEPSR